MTMPDPFPGAGRGLVATTFAIVALLCATTPAVAQKPVPNPFSDRLAALKDVPRRAVLRRAILDSTLWCDRVIQDKRQGSYRNLSMWSARCGRGAEYGIFIGTDQAVQVRPCSMLVKARLPACQLPPRKD